MCVKAYSYGGVNFLVGDRVRVGHISDKDPLNSKFGSVLRVKSGGLVVGFGQGSALIHPSKLTIAPKQYAVPIQMSVPMAALKSAGV